MCWAHVMRNWCRTRMQLMRRLLLWELMCGCVRRQGQGPISLRRRRRFQRRRARLLGIRRIAVGVSSICGCRRNLRWVHAGHSHLHGLTWLRNVPHETARRVDALLLKGMLLNVWTHAEVRSPPSQRHTCIRCGRHWFVCVVMGYNSRERHATFREVDG